jgi:MFS family permease
VATILGSSLTFIDGTVVNVALPALQADLHATIVQVQWVVEAYALFLGALILVGGSMGDQFGRRRVFLLGVVCFTIASVLCGFASSPAMLIAGRAVQGIGAGIPHPGNLAIISDIRRRRTRPGDRHVVGFTSITGNRAGDGDWLIVVSWRAVFLERAAGVDRALLSWRFVGRPRPVAESQTLDRSALAVLDLGGLRSGCSGPCSGFAAPSARHLTAGAVLPSPVLRRAAHLARCCC